MVFGRGRDVTAAEKAEARGDLVKAIELYVRAGQSDEAARIMILRGDAELDVRIRLQHYTQAVATATVDSEIRKQARGKRADFVLAQTAPGSLSSASRREVLAAAKELEEVGEARKAADAYRLAGDTEGEARSLAAAGEVDELEHLLGEQQEKSRSERDRKTTHARVDFLQASGLRREAVDLAEKWLSAHPDDRTLRDRVTLVRGRRALGPIAQIWLFGAPAMLVLGDEVTIGRTEGSLRVPSHAVSRQHLRIARENGAIVVRDLGSRNGTQLRGMNVVGAIAIGEGVELKLGKEVRCAIAPSQTIENGVTIELAGKTYVAPLGAARIAKVGWEIAQAADGWIQLVANDHRAYAGANELHERIDLVIGDVLSSERGGQEVLRVVGE